MVKEKLVLLTSHGRAMHFRICLLHVYFSYLYAICLVYWYFLKFIIVVFTTIPPKMVETVTCLVRPNNEKSVRIPSPSFASLAIGDSKTQ